jgi:hypothetical protein
MPTVFIVNKGGHDFSDADRFGRLRYLSEGMDSRYAVNKIYRDFAIKLRQSTPEDYILITGLTTMNIIACSCFGYMHGRLNLLIFKNNRYLERRLVLSELLDRGGNVEAQIKDMEKREEI